MSTPAERLRALIRARGPVPFAHFMEEALYGEGGYYRGAWAAIGEGGDFVTGSSLSPLFGRSTARLLERLDLALAPISPDREAHQGGMNEGGAGGLGAELLEVGYGNGDHLSAVLAGLSTRRPRRLRAFDQQARPLPAVAGHEGVGAVVELLASLDDVVEGEVEGLIFSYELFDALPVHRLIGQEAGALGELWVGLDPEGRFTWHPGELSDPGLRALLGGSVLAPGQVADLAPGWEPTYRRLARALGRGLLVTCDYGFERAKLLDPRVRRHGTLACYRDQRVHRDPFVEVGRQDLTAHVDFSRLIEVGEEEGLTTVALTRQALWLTACGLFDELAAGRAEPALRGQAMALLDGGGMGQETRVLVQTRAFEAEHVLDLQVLRAAL